MAAASSSTVSLASSTSVTLRPAQPADAVQLQALQQVIYDEARWFVGDGPPSVDMLTRRLRSLDLRHTYYLVALARTEGHMLQGHTLQGRTPRGKPTSKPRLCGWLELNRPQPLRLRHVAVLTLAVAPEWRGRGVGQHLLARAYAWAQRTGVKKIQLDVRSGNSAAIRLYKRQGFVLEGRERAQIRTSKQSNHYEDNLIMAKFLDDSLLTASTAYLGCPDLQAPDIQAPDIQAPELQAGEAHHKPISPTSESK
ncbi:MAG: GNAT family N-acetyltransferase [Deinococcota bacterium]